jgi:hypothetical protein
MSLPKSRGKEQLYGDTLDQSIPLGQEILDSTDSIRLSAYDE